MTWGGKTGGLSLARATLSRDLKVPLREVRGWRSHGDGHPSSLQAAEGSCHQCSLTRLLSNQCPIPGVMRKNNLGSITFLPQSASRQNGLMVKAPCSSQVLGICNRTLFQRVRKVTPTRQAWLLRNKLHPEFSETKKALACTQARFESILKKR